MPKNRLSTEILSTKHLHYEHEPLLLGGIDPVLHPDSESDADSLFFMYDNRKIRIAHTMEERAPLPWEEIAVYLQHG